MLGLNTLSKEVVRLENEVDKLRGSLEGAVSQDQVDALLEKFDKKWSKRIDEIENGIEGLDVIGESEQEGFSAKLVELREQLMRIGAMGGQANRDIKVNGANVLRPFTDINFKNGANVTITASTNQTTKYTDITIASSGGGGGSFSYTVNSISTDTTASETSGYIVYLIDASGGNVTLTLPTAAGNTALFAIKRTTAQGNTVTIQAFGSETIDGGNTALLNVQYESITIVSDNSNWIII